MCGSIKFFFVDLKIIYIFASSKAETGTRKSMDKSVKTVAETPDAIHYIYGVCAEIPVGKPAKGFLQRR
jgi:hypothetical protein